MFSDKLKSIRKTGKNAPILGPSCPERKFLEQYPSRSYTLDILGRKFPPFLSGPIRVPQKSLIREVAMLENAMDEVFHERAVAVLKPKDFASIPENRLEKTTLTFIPAFRLLTLKGPINAVVSAVKQNRSLPSLHQHKTWVAIVRKKYVLYRWDLTAPQHALLQKLHKGAPLGSALEAAFHTWKGSTDQFQKETFGWFSKWTGEGFFSKFK